MNDEFFRIQNSAFSISSTFKIILKIENGQAFSLGIVKTWFFGDFSLVTPNFLDTIEK